MAMTCKNTLDELTLDTGAKSPPSSSTPLDFSSDKEKYEHDEIMGDADFIALLESNRVTNKQALVAAEIERIKPNAFARLTYGFVFHQDLPSIGSALHFYDACIPCDSMGTKEGCIPGKYCGFCHYCPILHPSNGKNIAAEETGTERRESATNFEDNMRRWATQFQERRGKPRSDQNATNLGSLNHAAAAGHCHPCFFIHKGECQNGDACTHCHICDSSLHRVFRRLVRKKVGNRLNKLIKNGNTANPLRFGGEI